MDFNLNTKSRKIFLLHTTFEIAIIPEYSPRRPPTVAEGYGGTRWGREPFFKKVSSPQNSFATPSDGCHTYTSNLRNGQKSSENFCL